MGTVGYRLLSSIVLSGDQKQFLSLGLEEHLFKGEEIEVYHFVTGHFAKHGKIPSPDTVEEKYGAVIEQVSEPPSFYLELVEARFLHNSLKMMMQQAGSLLQDNESEKALAVILEEAAKLHHKKNRKHLIDFRDIGSLIGNEYKKVKSGADEGVYFGWPSLDNMTGGLKPGDVCSIVGRPACLSGETKLYISRKKKGSGRWYTLAEIYRGLRGLPIHPFGKGSGKVWDLTIPTRTQCLMDDDLTGLNVVEAVVYSGKKTTYTLTTESGKWVRATKDHMFLTAEGYMRLEDLSVGSAINCTSKRETTTKYLTPYRKEICTKLPHSPYPTRVINGCQYHRVKEQRACYDAMLNGLSLNAFLDRLREGPSEGLVFSDRALHIHHLDGNVANNHPANLMLVSNSEHGKLHASETPVRKHFGANEVGLEKVVSIEEYGVEDTYDVVMQDPYNNFVAHGMVTHNSGKTFMGLYCAHQAWNAGHRPLFVSMEMNNTIIAQRLACMHTSKNLTQLLKGMLSSTASKEMFTKLASLKGEKQPLWLVDGNLTATVEDILMRARQLSVDSIWIDGAYLLGHNAKFTPSRWDRITDNAENIKRKIAGDLGLPVVSSYQFNRDVVKSLKGSKKKKDDKDPSEFNASELLSDIYGTDAIAQLSTIVLGLLQPESIETQKERTVGILKGRNGEAGKFRIRWDFQKMNFSEIVEEDPAELQFL